MSKIAENILVEKIVYKGVGLGRLDGGKKILIEGNPLPGSTVDVEITKKKKGFVVGKIIETKTYDQSIVSKETKCPHYKNPLNKEKTVACGGCKRQIITYEKQLQIKEDIVLDSFRQKPKLLENAQILPIQKAPKQYHYRNKVEHSFGASEENQRQLGFHASGSFQHIVDVNQCFLVSLKAYQVFKEFKKILQDSGFETYKQEEHTGVLRHLVMREGYNTNQLLINLVYAEKNIQDSDGEKRQQTIDKITQNDKIKKLVTTMLVTTNNSIGDSINPDMSQVILRGKGYIYEKLEGTKNPKTKNDRNSLIVEEGIVKEIKSKKEETQIDTETISTFKISPFSFFQTNTHGAELMIDMIEALLQHHKVSTLLDLYCGTGTLGLSLLKRGIGEKLIGIEIVQTAIKDAWHNAEINNLEKQVYFSAGKAEEVIYKDEYLQSKIEDINTIIVDPPRNGLHKKVIGFLSKLKKQTDFTLIYVSCNPVTLARDCQSLSESNFQVQSLQALDMFPQTYHIETITLLK